MSKKLDKVNIDEIITKILLNNESSMIDAMAHQYIRTTSFSKTVEKVLKEATEAAIYHKISTISDFFTQQFTKYFTNHITTITDEQIKLRLETDPRFKKAFDENLSKYLQDMNFETTMMDFFNNKKELLMELMLRQMFNDKKPKEGL